MQKLSRSLIAFAGLAALAACGDDVSIAAPTPTPVAVVGVTVSPQTLTLKVGEKATLGVSVETTGGAVTTVTWSSSTPSVATVSATGEVTAVTAGNTTVRAVSTADASKSGAAQVTVSALAVRSVNVSPDALSLQIGQTATAVATVDRDAGVAGTVTWASNNAAVATVNATSGLITAVTAGTAVISATSTVDNTKSDALAVTVTAVPNNLTALSVAPVSAALGVGGTLQLVPSATTVGTPTITYTYASSNTDVATVSSTGLVTAVGNGTAVITTTATTNTNSLSVATTITVASASVSISSITTGLTNTPVNIANVFGQIEVTMNISAGNQSLDSVVVLLGTKTGASQGFTVNGAPNAPVTLSINTARYAINADSSSTVDFLNGSTGVQAQLFVKGATGPTASNTITINLNNSDTFHARWSLPSNSATSAAGFLWYGGPNTSTTVNVIPVMYSGNVINSATIHLDDASVDGNASLCGAAVTDVTAPFTANFTCAGLTNANVQPAVSASLRADGNAGPASVVAIDLAGAPVGTLFANAALLVQASQVPVRIDVLGPGVATYAFVAPTTNDYWANAAFRHDVSTTNLFSRTRAVDAGVGTTVATSDIYEYEDNFVAGTAWVTHAPNPTGIPEHPQDFTVNAYSGRVTEFDLLGNSSVTYLGSTATAPGTQVFGVDVTGPIVTYLSTAIEPRTLLPQLDTLGNTRILTNDGNIANTIRADSGYFGIRYTDQRSGFGTTPGVEPQFLRIQRLGGPPSIGANTCVVGVVVSGACTYARRLGAVDNIDPAFRRDTTNVYGSGINASGGGTGVLYTPVTFGDSAGYYTYETYVVDRAGNVTTPAGTPKTVAVDTRAPLTTGLNPIGAGLTGGGPNTWLPIAADELEVLDAALALRYPNMAVGTATDSIYFGRTFITDFKAPFSGSPLAGLVGPGQTYGNLGVTPMSGGNTVNFVRSIDVALAADSTAPLAVTATAKPIAALAESYDIRGFTSSAVVYPNLSSGLYATVILPTQVTNGVPVVIGPAGSQWYVYGVQTTGSAIVAEVKQTTVLSNSPFTQVQFFRENAAFPGRWVFLGSINTLQGTNPISFDQGGNRFWRYTLSGVAPAVAVGDRIRAVGVTAAGDGLATPDFVK